MTTAEATKIREAQNYVLAYAEGTLEVPAWFGEEDTEDNVMAEIHWLMLVNGYPRTHQYKAGVDAHGNPA